MRRRCTRRSSCKHRRHRTDSCCSRARSRLPDRTNHPCRHFRHCNPAAYRRRIRQYGLTDHLASIRSIDVPILDLLSTKAQRAFIAAGAEAIEKDGADTLVLGCTGMSPAVPAIRAELRAPLVDPAACAITLAEMIAKLGLTHSVLSFPMTGGSSLTGAAIP